MKKYKLVVLSDMKENLGAKLKGIANFSKMVGAHITVLHVIKPSDLVKKENQLSAMRTINDEYSSTDKKMRSIVKTFSKDKNININYLLTLGNIKEEIESYIKREKPDIVVLGKKSGSPLTFLGDNITQFVLKKHDGAILIADDDNLFEPNSNFSLGTLDDGGFNLNLEFAKDLMKHSQRPLKSFKIIKKSSPTNEKATSNPDSIEYVFERNDNTIEKLPGYLEKNNIGLLFVSRGPRGVKSKTNLISSDISGIINRLKFPVMISNNQNTI